MRKIMVLISLLFLIGCEDGKKRHFEACNSSSECESGICYDGYCTKGCDTDPLCPDGSICKSVKNDNDQTEQLCVLASTIQCTDDKDCEYFSADGSVLCHKAVCDKETHKCVYGEVYSGANCSFRSSSSNSSFSHKNLQLSSEKSGLSSDRENGNEKFFLPGVCFLGECRKVCETDSDCPDGEFCSFVFSSSQQESKVCVPQGEDPCSLLNVGKGQETGNSCTSIFNDETKGGGCALYTSPQGMECEEESHNLKGVCDVYGCSPQCESDKDCVSSSAGDHRCVTVIKEDNSFFKVCR